MQKQALSLVLAIYRITNLFPEGEVLIKQIRKTANQILKEAILGRVKEIRKQIEILLGYIDIAQNQKWVKDINFIILKKEYQKLLNSVNKSKKKIKKVNSPKIRLTQRQKRIIEYLKNKNEIKSKELNFLFPEINTRTIQSDLKEMISKGIISRNGKGRGSFYKIIAK